MRRSGEFGAGTASAIRLKLGDCRSRANGGVGPSKLTDEVEAAENADDCDMRGDACGKGSVVASDGVGEAAAGITHPTVKREKKERRKKNRRN